MNRNLKQQAMADARYTVQQVWGGIRLSYSDRRAELLRAFRLRLAWLRLATKS